MTVIELYTFYFTKSKVCYIFKNSKNQPNLPKTLTQQLTSKLTDFQIKFCELAKTVCLTL